MGNILDYYSLWFAIIFLKIIEQKNGWRESIRNTFYKYLNGEEDGRRYKNKAIKLYSLVLC